MIKPQKAMFLFKPKTEKGEGTIIIGDSDRRGEGLYREWPMSLGACFSHWKSMSDEDIYHFMAWLTQEIAELYGVPIKNIRDAMEDNVLGYKEYSRKIGRMALPC